MKKRKHICDPHKKETSFGLHHVFSFNLGILIEKRHFPFQYLWKIKENDISFCVSIKNLTFKLYSSIAVKTVLFTVLIDYIPNHYDVTVGFLEFDHGNDRFRPVSGRKPAMDSSRKPGEG